jgi:hypothetical protein
VKSYIILGILAFLVVVLVACGAPAATATPEPGPLLTSEEPQNVTDSTDDQED